MGTLQCFLYPELVRYKGLKKFLFPRFDIPPTLCSGFGKRMASLIVNVTATWVIKQNGSCSLAIFTA